jgi:ParB family chromosome partitioning protein
MLAHGDIEMGHARALLSLSFDQQGSVAREIAAQHLNVRQAEALVRKLLSGKSAPKPGAKGDADTRSLENKLSTRIGQKVNIQHTAKGKGKLVIAYNSLDELDGILGHFGDLE